MKAWCCALAFCLFACLSARADDGFARQLFDDGVAATRAGRWQDAVKLFSASLGERDRPATRFNLILSYWELQEPLQVVRHALAFLSGPESESQRASRAHAAALLEQASKQLTTLDIGGLPPSAQLKVDGEDPLRTATHVYVQPGPHRLEARFAPDTVEEAAVDLTAGETRLWPRSERGHAPEAGAADTPAPALAPTTPVLTPPSEPAAKTSRERTWSRPVTAAVVGGLGTAIALSAAGCLWLAESRADRIARGGVEAAQGAGHFHAVDRYVRVTNTIVPLALVGGALTATASLLGERLLRRGSWAWSLASLAVGAALLGLGGFWSIRTPRDLLTGTDIQRPSRQAGGLLSSASLPFLSYGIASPIVRGRKGALALRGLLHASVTW